MGSYFNSLKRKKKLHSIKENFERSLIKRDRKRKKNIKVDINHKFFLLSPI